MKTMVVGGAGFVGSHLVDRLLAEEIAVDVIDDLSSGSLANLAEARAVGGLSIHTLDVCSTDFATLVAMRRPNVVVHLATLTPSQRDSDTDGRAVAALLAVLEAARTNAVDKVVVTIPGGRMYGDLAQRDLPVKEGRPYEPAGVRGVLAKTATELLQVYREQHGVEHTALALATVYGPRQRAGDGVVASMASAAAAGRPLRVDGDGRQTRDLLFIDDAVDAVFRAVQRGSGLVVNVATGTQTAIRDLARAIAPGSDVEQAPRRRGDLGRVSLSPTRARIHLQWSPWTSLDDGLAATLAWHRGAGG
jgi:UDP-glucose 4-epimerase